LARTNITEADQNAIAIHLCGQNLKAILCFPDQRGKARLPVPDAAIQQLITRLRLTRAIHQRLTRVINQYIPVERSVYRTRVKLRNAKIAQSEIQINFLCALIPNLYDNSDEYWRLFGFAIELLEQTDADA